MKDYIAIFTSKTQGLIAVQFKDSGKLLAQAAAQRYARDFVLCLEKVVAV
jgi:hypothetical protein